MNYCQKFLPHNTISIRGRNRKICCDRKRDRRFVDQSSKFRINQRATTE